MVIMLSVIMLNVIFLSVVAPIFQSFVKLDIKNIFVNKQTNKTLLPSLFLLPR
jgi:hypothetical protein